MQKFILVLNFRSERHSQSKKLMSPECSRRCPADQKPEGSGYDKQTLGITKKLIWVIKEHNLQTSVLRPKYLHVQK